MGAERVLEIGTSNGYSTIWLGDAAEAVGGSVVSLEIEAERTAAALDNLTQAGVDEFVELRTQDAAEALAAFADGAFDLVFLDAERREYASYWPDLCASCARAACSSSTTRSRTPRSSSSSPSSSTPTSRVDATHARWRARRRLPASLHAIVERSAAAAGYCFGLGSPPHAP